MDKTQATVLIVDDSPENLLLLENILDTDYKVKVASTGMEALSIANDSPQPDIILLDVMMPEMDGHQVCTALKNSAETAQIPIIFVTGMDDEKDEALGFELGAVDYILKPISIPTVLARVSTHLALHTHNRQLENQYQKKNLELIEKNVQLVGEIQEREKLENTLRESRKNLRKLTNHIQAIREEEKAAIAREIHDELGGTLTAIKFDAVWMAKRLPSTERPLIDKMMDVINLVDSSVATIRRIVTELRPTILDDLGLWAALEWQCQEFMKRTGIEITLDISCPQFHPNQHQSTSLFRVVQESLTNVVRHASATQVKISCRSDDNHFSLWIRDNGIGFSVKMNEPPTSHGILGMCERIEELGGTIHFDGIGDVGTTIKITLPIKQ